MAKKKYLLTATLPDGYVKTIGPTSIPFTHYWRIVAELANGKTEVFWGHASSLKQATGKQAAAAEAARQRGWTHYDFAVVAVTESERPGRDAQAGSISNSETANSDTACRPTYIPAKAACRVRLGKSVTGAVASDHGTGRDG